MRNIIYNDSSIIIPWRIYSRIGFFMNTYAILDQYGDSQNLMDLHSFRMLTRDTKILNRNK
jgi:hypothetical protein